MTTLNRIIPKSRWTRKRYDLPYYICLSNSWRPCIMTSEKFEKTVIHEKWHPSRIFFIKWKNHFSDTTVAKSWFSVKVVNLNKCRKTQNHNLKTRMFNESRHEWLEWIAYLAGVRAEIIKFNKDDNIPGDRIKWHTFREHRVYN